MSCRSGDPGDQAVLGKAEPTDNGSVPSNLAMSGQLGYEWRSLASLLPKPYCIEGLTLDPLVTAKS